MYLLRYTKVLYNTFYSYLVLLSLGILYGLGLAYKLFVIIICTDYMLIFFVIFLSYFVEFYYNILHHNCLTAYCVLPLMI